MYYLQAAAHCIWFSLLLGFAPLLLLSSIIAAFIYDRFYGLLWSIALVVFFPIWIGGGVYLMMQYIPENHSLWLLGQTAFHLLYAIPYVMLGVFGKKRSLKWCGYLGLGAVLAASAGISMMFYFGQFH